jgi:1-acyl-sn-glycerol-3-phosphate acyltransferase
VSATTPRRVLWLIRGFRAYVRRFLRKNFHAVRLSKTSAVVPKPGVPIIVVLNHPSWWDPLIVTLLSDLFPGAEHYGAIDAEAVKKYPVFQKLGFFPVDSSSLRGAAEFLKLATHILSEPNRIVWLTAQGEFADVRTRPLNLRTGVGHLAARVPDAVIVPIAIEYSFWTEKAPEALVRIGVPIRTSDHAKLHGKEWTTIIEAGLTETLDTLNRETMTRNPALFTPLIEGRSAIGGMYDLWRRLAAWATGRKFQSEHTLGTPQGAS